MSDDEVKVQRFTPGQSGRKKRKYMTMKTSRKWRSKKIAEGKLTDEDVRVVKRAQTGEAIRSPKMQRARDSMIQRAKHGKNMSIRVTNNPYSPRQTIKSKFLRKLRGGGGPGIADQWIRDPEDLLK